MIAAALEAKVEQYVFSFTEEVDEKDKRLVAPRRARAGTAPDS